MKKHVFLLEIAVILAAVLFFTQPYHNDDKLYGREAEWLTSSLYFAEQTLREEGRIPLWQPYLADGEPFINNPFTPLLNPISSLPSLLFGALWGVNISIVLTAMVAGVGGWFLGRMCGMAWPARILLGLLLVGKGNMAAMIGIGYFQLGTAQAYFPWIFAGLLAIFDDPRARWPVLLTAFSFALLYFAGNIWYTLPTLIGMAFLILLYRRGWRSLMMAGFLTVGLCAVTLLPLWMERDFIGGHPDDLSAGQSVGFWKAAGQYFQGEQGPYRTASAPGHPQFYHSFVVPRWFLLLVFLIPVGWPLEATRWRIGVAALSLLVLMTLWGAGGHPIMRTLYENIPGLGQWRFVGRALAVGSFWLALLAALRFDGLWRGLLASLDVMWNWPAYLLALGLLVSCAVVSLRVNQVWAWDWYKVPGVAYIDPPDEICLDWLRREYPDGWLSVWRVGYDAIYPYLNGHIRKSTIEADFYPRALPWTMSHENIIRSSPRYAMAWDEMAYRSVIEAGYRPVADSPQPVNDRPCLYERDDALPYAYTVPLDTLETVFSPLTSDQITPTPFQHHPDRITLQPPDSAQSSVLVVSEVAYTGWRVRVDGESAPLESVGGFLGVRLDSGRHEIEFAYRPIWLFRGAGVSLLSLVAAVVYALWGRIGDTSAKSRNRDIP